jgi:endonuclease/exonuclease/phosphatase family metal-dependent hydrolase
LPAVIRSPSSVDPLAMRLGAAFLWATCALFGNLSASEGTDSLTIASYNVENYILMPRRIDGRIRQDAGKPESEKNAVVRMIGTIHPDVLGIMELGEPVQLEDLRTRLKEAGMDYPHVEYLRGSDTTRHLALLSRFPIVESHSRGDLPLRVHGMTLHSPRGILDITVEPSPGYRIRILCVHLKAKLEAAEYSESELREAESREMRRLVREILRANPEERLIVLGDFNDTKNEKTIREILGKPDWPDSIRALPLRDERGEFWTEYWSGADVYSRIDYMMISRKLETEIDPARSGIARPPFWNEASDHCPLYLTIRQPRPTP